jgi:hypothetical protein
MWITVGLGLLLVWHFFAWIYFGSPLPVTLAAKQAQGRMAISQHFAPGVLRIVSWYSKGLQYKVQLGLAMIGLIFSLLRKQQWALILGWTGLYFLAYALLGVTSYFWYYAPLVPGWVVAVGLGIALISWLPLPSQEQLSSLWNNVRPGLVGMLLTALFVAQAITVQKMSQQTDPRYMVYRSVGEWLARNIPADARVGALEIGMIGYFSQRSVVDFAGLIQPDVADQMQTDTTYDDTALWAVQTYKPEYLVLIDGAHPRLEAEVVAEYCQSVKNFPDTNYDFSADMKVYACQYH